MTVTLTDAIERFASETAERIETALKDAILNDYDGVDVNYTPHTESYHIQSIEPWRYDEDGNPPDGDNGYRTERYTWDWFDQEKLKAEIRKDGGRRLVSMLSD